MAKLELTCWSNKISWQSIAISRICSCQSWCNTIVSWSVTSPACPNTFLFPCLVTECDMSCSAALLTPNLFTKRVPQPWVPAPAKGSGGSLSPILKGSATLGLCQPCIHELLLFPDFWHVQTPASKLQNHRKAWVERHLKNHPVCTPLPWTERPCSRPGCSGPHPV